MKNENLNIAIIGAGWWACFNHIPGLMKFGVKNFFIADKDESKFGKIKKEFNEIEHFYTDVDEMLSKHEVHGAVIASPHTAHFSNGAAVLKKGKPIFVEKPMTTSLTQAKELVKLAQDNNTQIMIPHGLNYLSSTLKAKEIFSQIGKVHHVSAVVGSALLDLFTSQDLAGTEDHLFRPPVNTWSNPNNAGGYAWGQLVHLLGLMFTIVDDDPWKLGGFVANSSSDVDMYNAVAGKFKSGATFSISGAGSVPKSRDFRTNLNIFGENGMFLFDMEENRERLEVLLHSGKEEIIKVERKDCAYDGYSPLQPFIRLCKNELPANENHSDGIVGLRSVAIIDAMFESAKTEKIIEVKL